MKVTIQDLVNQTYCPELFRLGREQEESDDDLFDRFRTLAVYVFRNDLEDLPKLTLAEVTLMWKEIFFKKRKRSASILAPVYLQTLVFLNEFYKFYISLPQTFLGINYNVRNYHNGIILYAPITAMFVSGEDNSILNVVHLISTKTRQTLNLDRPDIAYPISTFAESEEASSFGSIRVHLLNLVNLEGEQKKTPARSPFKLQQQTFFLSQDYVNEGKQYSKAVMTSIRMDLPNNLLGCPACPLGEICKVKKGNE